ncbi:MAG: OmpA family protein [Firmicutes bacterium]|nr:OmpA family protein [Bacillota bacterium]
MAKVSLRGVRRRSTDFESLWLITFADLMVQLMAFFAVIYSMKVQDQAHMGDLAASLQKALGLATTTDKGHGAAPLPPVPNPSEKAADLESLLSDLKATEGPDVGSRMRIVTFRGSILFPEGSATIDPTFEPLLNRIAELSVEYPGFYLVCEGHAAEGEKGRGNADALDLSGQRAQTVLRYLMGKGMDAQLMTAEAHGDSRPDAKGASPEGRALQRRVKFRYQRAAAN